MDRTCRVLVDSSVYLSSLGIKDGSQLWGRVNSAWVVDTLFFMKSYG